MADSMQNDAMERFRQMYSKAQPPPTSPQNRKEEEKVDEKTSAFDEKSPVVHTQKGENLLDFFMRDKEKSLILLLIVILMSEKADTTLILALMYLVL